MSILLAGQFEPSIFSQRVWLDMLLIRWPIALAPALFTWLLPVVLRYRRGQMAWIGLGVALLFTVLLPLGLVVPLWNDLYWQIHYWLYSVFYIYALAGIALCGVGVYDGKRSAIWALLAVLCLTGGAVGDTLIWFGLFRSTPWVPWGFLAFGALTLIAWLRRPADRASPANIREAAQRLANNYTRRSRSIPRKLLREGSLHMLPVYYVLNLSDLGREGIQRSGSYRFADHIYRSVPSGRGALGRWIDARMLATPACRAFRHRYQRARDEMRRALESQSPDVRPLRVLAIPCGLPRDLTEMAEALKKENPELLGRIEYHGMDIDPELLRLAGEFTAGCPLASREFHQGNALLRETFPPGPFHFIVSTGLNEFLKRDELECFYRNVFDVLAPGGTFFTSATQREPRGEKIMRAFELDTEYHTPDELDEILSQLPWCRLKLIPHETGLQDFVVARK
jgi:SAM-dependent methyltransferase